MLQGIEKLAHAVAVTLGATGPGVVIQHRTDGITPVFTRDGVTVANSIHLSDRLEDVGARMLRDVAGATSREAGDGTTTAVVLARIIARECARSLAAGNSPTELKKGIDLAAQRVCLALQERAITHLDDSLLRKTCHSAGKEDERVADLLIEALNHVGPKGKVNIEMGHSRRDELEVLEGANFEQGYLSPYFSTDHDRNLAELDEPYILLCDREIDDFMDLVPLLEAIQAQHRSLLIIAEGVSDRALAPLTLNHVRGNFRAVAVKPPGYGDKRKDRLRDLALLTGGRVCLEEQGNRLELWTLADLGQARRAVIGTDSTSILGAKGERGPVEDLIAGLELEAARIRARKPGEGSPTGNQHDLDELEQRIDQLHGRTAAFKVGGVTDLEIKDRLVRVENAYNSIRAALEEGVLPGGGVGLMSMQSALDDLVVANADRQRGVDIVRFALEEPLRRIAANAGTNPEKVLAQVLASGDPAYGYDVNTRSFGNLIELGVLDPVKVTRLALKNAAAIVGTVITTEAVITEEPILKRFPNSAAIANWAAATREDPRA
jgi:chaperonin GroEL